MFFSDQVEADLRHRVATSPESPAANNNLGLHLRQLGRFQEAKASLQKAFWLNPGSADIAFNFACVLIDLSESNGAVFALQRAVRIKPLWPDAHRFLGRVLQSLARWDEAEHAFRRAIALEPNGALAYIALGDLLRLRRRFAEAEMAYRRALTLDPTAVQVYNGLAFALTGLQRPEEAEKFGRQALVHYPNNPAVKLTLAFILLKLGRYEDGWKFYESRFEKSKEWDTENFLFPYPTVGETPDKRWAGNSLAGKALVVVPEQGLGDAIQFARFMPMLKALGLSRLAVGCQPVLVRLMGFVDGIDEVLDASQNVEFASYDAWCYMISAAHHLGMTLDNLPADVPYLRLPQDLVVQWQDVLNARVSCEKPRIGLVWAASRGLDKPRPGRRITDTGRTMALKSLGGLLSNRDVEFVSLQLISNQEELTQIPAELRPADMMDGVTDLADTAAIIQNLDLVISVDTSMAHLAGALGKPVWIMLPFDGDWRWLVDREDSPWYPSARIFRQERPDDWNGVIERVEQALRMAVQAGEFATTAEKFDARTGGLGGGLCQRYEMY